MTSRTALAVGQEASSSVLDGVFTSAQALLRGGASTTRTAPPAMAQTSWGTKWPRASPGTTSSSSGPRCRSVHCSRELRCLCRRTARGGLSDEEYTDVLAYLLDASSYPSGESELPADKAALDQIMIVAPAE